VRQMRVVGAVKARDLLALGLNVQSPQPALAFSTRLGWFFLNTLSTLPPDKTHWVDFASLRPIPDPPHETHPDVSQMTLPAQQSICNYLLELWRIAPFLIRPAKLTPICYIWRCPAQQSICNHHPDETPRNSLPITVSICRR